MPINVKLIRDKLKAQKANNSADAKPTEGKTDGKSADPKAAAKPAESSTDKNKKAAAAVSTGKDADWGERGKEIAKRFMQAVIKIIMIIGAAISEVIDALKEGHLIDAAMALLMAFFAILNVVGWVMFIWGVTMFVLVRTIPESLLPTFRALFIPFAVIAGVAFWHWLQEAEMLPGYARMNRSMAQREYNRARASEDKDVPEAPPEQATRYTRDLHSTLVNWNDKSQKKAEQTSGWIYTLDWIGMYFAFMPFTIIPAAINPVGMVAWIGSVKGYEFLANQRELFREKHPKLRKS